MAHLKQAFALFCLTVTKERDSEKGVFLISSVHLKKYFQVYLVDVPLCNQQWLRLYGE
jgi:hypothetical protein